MTCADIDTRCGGAGGRVFPSPRAACRPGVQPRSSGRCRSLRAVAFDAGGEDQAVFVKWLAIGYCSERMMQATEGAPDVCGRGACSPPGKCTRSALLAHTPWRCGLISAERVPKPAAGGKGDNTLAFCVCQRYPAPGVCAVPCSPFPSALVPSSQELSILRQRRVRPRSGVLVYPLPHGGKSADHHASRCVARVGMLRRCLCPPAAAAQPVANPAASPLRAAVGSLRKSIAAPTI